MSDSAANPSPGTNVSQSLGAPGAPKFGRFWLALPLIVVIGLAALVVFTERDKPELLGGLKPGETFPEIEAPAWINGEPPPKAELAGHIVVVEVWASWCPQCQWLAGQLAEMEKKYEGRGVIFIGLTSDGKDSLPEIESFIKKSGMTFPNGYGAIKTVQRTKCESVPAMWAIGPDGKVIWNRDMAKAPDKPDGLPIDAAIDRELARMAGKS